jgi:outer membrane receptor protein involved in Fe transport
VGYGQSIKRPNVLDLTGLFAIDEVNQIIRASNPELKPETGTRVAGSIAYYLPGNGSMRATFTDTRIENLKTLTEFTAEEYGLTDPELFAYTVITNTQGPGTQRFRSMELEYRSMLTLLPPQMGRATVFASYTRTYASERRVGLTPHVVTGGFDYNFRGFSVGLRTRWEDQAPWSNLTRYRPQVVRHDANLSARLSARLTFFVQARNIFNKRTEIFEQSGNLFVAENYGANWVFGLRGQF